jgi:hypothetical protein
MPRPGGRDAFEVPYAIAPSEIWLPRVIVMVLFLLPYAVVIYLIARTKGKSPVLWFIVAFIPVVNVSCLWVVSLTDLEVKNRLASLEVKNTLAEITGRPSP